MGTSLTIITCTRHKQDLSAPLKLFTQAGLRNHSECKPANKYQMQGC